MSIGASQSILVTLQDSFHPLSLLIELVGDMHKFRIRLLPGALAVCKLPAGSPIPPWAISPPFFCITSTREELSLVCSAEVVPSSVHWEGPWRAFQLEGPIPFTLTGVLASVLNPLAENRVGIFALSTFDTDYVLVNAGDATVAASVLRGAGHEIVVLHDQ